jgi:hypothetical protein
MSAALQDHLAKSKKRLWSTSGSKAKKATGFPWRKLGKRLSTTTKEIYIPILNVIDYSKRTIKVNFYPTTTT